MQTNTHIYLIRLALPCVALAVLPGCNDDSSTTISINNGGTRVNIQTVQQQPATLTPEQGRQLLIELQTDPDRRNNLTLAERRYLATTVLDDDDDDRR